MSARPTDTPILDGFYAALLKGIRCAWPYEAIKWASIDVPMDTYEVEGGVGDLLHRRFPGSLGTRVFDAARKVWGLERDRLLARVDRIPPDRAFVLAFEAEGGCFVTTFTNHVGDPSGNWGIAIDPFLSRHGKWYGSPNKIVAHSDPALDFRSAFYSDQGKGIRDYVKAVDALHGAGEMVGFYASALSAMIVLNEFFDRWDEIQSADPIYRMSNGKLRWYYNARKHRKHAPIVGDARIIDLTKPKVVVVPVGPSMPTGRTVKPYVHPGRVVRYKSPRYVNLIGQTRVIDPYSVHGAAIDADVRRTLVKGLGGARIAEAAVEQEPA